VLKKTIICLANSRKLNGRCIAGIEHGEAENNPWVRPITTSPTGEIATPDAAYSEGQQIAVLDLLEVNLQKHSPKTYQQENWMIAPEMPWRKIGRAEHTALFGIVSRIPGLWVDGQSSGTGENDRITEAEANTLQDSLRLIRVNDLELQLVHVKDQTVNLRAKFEYSLKQYSLRVTDPAIEKHFSTKPLGRYHCSRAYLTISLGEPFGGHVYKLVAAVIPESRTESVWRT